MGCGKGTLREAWAGAGGGALSGGIGRHRPLADGRRFQTEAGAVGSSVWPTETTGQGSTGCRVLRKSHLASQALSDFKDGIKTTASWGVCVGKGFGGAERW